MTAEFRACGIADFLEQRSEKRDGGRVQDGEARFLSLLPPMLSTRSPIPEVFFVGRIDGRCRTAVPRTVVAYPLFSPGRNDPT